MKLSCMISEIIHIIDTQYEKYVEEDCLDIHRIKKFCNLYKQKSITIDTRITTTKHINLSDIVFSSPDVSKVTKNNNLKKNKLNTPEFNKIYTLFIKLLHACLKLKVEIFTVSNKKDDIYCVIKNNYNLIKSIESSKKKIITDHINILQKQHKHISSINISEYETYLTEYVMKLKIFDRLISWVDVLEKNDNLCSLILPYFYTYTEYIEEYIG